MDLQLRPLSAGFGVEVLDVDLRGGIDDSLGERLLEAWRRHALLVFRNQEGLSDDRLQRIISVFGEISNEGAYPKYISNVIPNLTPSGELLFHMDFSWSDNPLRGLALYAYEAPPIGTGGETLFASAQLAYELLPAALRERVDQLQIVHATKNVSAQRPKVSSTHPIAFPHPVTGEKLLYCSPRHFDSVVGLSAEDGQALCDELAAHLYRPELVLQHTWLPGDLAVWDNLKLQHARTNWDPKYRRHLQRFQIAAPIPVTI